MITKNDLIQLSQLLNKGYSVSTALTILGNYEKILKKLNQGEELSQFINYQSKDPFYRSLKFFMNVSSFDHAVISAYEYQKMKKKMKAEWLKETTYPLFVLAFALSVFLFFEIFIYPQLQNLIDLQKGIRLHHFLYICVGFVILLLIIVLLLAFLLLIMKKFQIEKYHLLYEQILGKCSIIQKMVSYDYALHSLILMQRGYSTKQVFECLLELKNSLFLQINLKDMTLKLQRGEEMIEIIENQSYFDRKFRQFFKIGYYTQNLEGTMQDYCEFQRNEFKRILKLSSKIISTGAYLLIGVLVVSIYQLLLLPLDMMNQL